MADTKVSAETLVSEVKANYKMYIVCDTGAAPDSNAARMSQVKEYLEITSPPQGRLTVASNTPVLTASDTGNTTMYYTPYVGRLVPLYDGTRFVMTDMGGELSQLLSDTGESPAAAAAASVYDYYAFLKNGSPVLSRARAWESATARDTGNALEQVEGIYLNKTAYTNGPAAQRGTYIGTIRTDPSSAEVTWRYGAAAANGLDGVHNIWNMYNRITVAGMVRDTTDSWTYNSTTIQAPNNSATMRVSFVRGLDEDAAMTNYFASGTGGASTNGITGASLDSTTAANGFMSYSALSGSLNGSSSAGWQGLPGLGFHFISAVEKCVNAINAVTWYGDAGLAGFQTGFAYSLRA